MSMIKVQLYQKEASSRYVVIIFSHKKHSKMGRRSKKILRFITIEPGSYGSFDKGNPSYKNTVGQDHTELCRSLSANLSVSTEN